jgi:hypothetical protein
VNDNPVDILKAASVECPELDDYTRRAPHTSMYGDDNYYPGKDALTALARLVAKLTCCGNCGNVKPGESGICITGVAPEDDPDGLGNETWNATIEPHHNCHFAPSRWEARNE